MTKRLIALLCSFCLLVIPSCTTKTNTISTNTVFTEPEGVATFDILAEMHTLYPEYTFKILDEDYSEWSEAATGQVRYSVTAYLQTDALPESVITCIYESSHDSFKHNFESILTDTDSLQSVRQLLDTNEIIYWINPYEDKLAYDVMTTAAVPLTAISEEYYNAGIVKLYAGVSEETFGRVKAKALAINTNISYAKDLNDFLVRLDETYTDEAYSYREYQLRDKEIVSVMLYYDDAYHSIACEGEFLRHAVIDNVNVHLTKNATFPQYCNLSYDYFNHNLAVNEERLSEKFDSDMPDMLGNPDKAEYYAITIADMKQMLQSEKPDRTFEVVMQQNGGNYVDCLFKDNEDLLYYAWGIEGAPNKCSTFEEAAEMAHTRAVITDFLGDDCLFNVTSGIVCTKVAVSLVDFKTLVADLGIETLELHSGVSDEDYEYIKNLSINTGSTYIMQHPNGLLPYRFCSNSPNYRYYNGGSSALKALYYIEDGKVYYISAIANASKLGQTTEIDNIAFSTALSAYNTTNNIPNTEECWLGWDEYF